MRTAISLSAEWASAVTLPARTTTSPGACEIFSVSITWPPPARCRRLVESTAMPRARTTSFSTSRQTRTAARATANRGSVIRRARIPPARRLFLPFSPERTRLAIGGAFIHPGRRALAAPPFLAFCAPCLRSGGLQPAISSFFLTVLLIAGCSADSRPLEQLKWNPFFNAFILTYMHACEGEGGRGLGWELGRALRDSRTKMLICPFLFTGHATRSTQSRSAERQSRNGNFELSFLASLCEIHARLSQYAMGPTSFSTSAVSTMTMASHGQPSRKPLSAWFFSPSRACYNARASDSSSPAYHVPQTVLQTPLARPAHRTWIAPLLHLAFPLLFRRHGLLRRAGPQLAVPRRLRFLLPWAHCCLGCAGARISGVSRRDLFSRWHGPESRHAGASVRRSCDVRPGGRHRQPFSGGRSRCDAQPRCGRGTLADGALPVHRELHRGAAYGSAGDIFHHAGAADFLVPCGNGNRSHFVETRFTSRLRDLVRRRDNGWARNARQAGNAAASCGHAGSAVDALSPPRELQQARACNALDASRFAAAAGDLGGPQRCESWASAIPCATLRGNIRRRATDGFLRVDENVDVSFSRRVSLHLEGAVAADRIKKSSAVRGGFAEGIRARGCPARALQPRARHDANAGSRIRRAGAGTRAAPSNSHLRMDPDGARHSDVVHSADYTAALLRPALAACGKLPQQCDGL